MGTRHRAALGLAEQADAVIITISEESGKISLCIDNKFHVCRSAGELRQFLRHLLIGEKLGEDFSKNEEVTS